MMTRVTFTHTEMIAHIAESLAHSCDIASVYMQVFPNRNTRYDKNGTYDVQYDPELDKNVPDPIHVPDGG